MKILYIVHCHQMGGSNIALFNILDYMKKIHDVRVVCPKPIKKESLVIDYLERNNIKYYSDIFYDAFVYGTDKNPIRRFIRTFGRVLRHLRGRIYIEKVIKEYKPDIVHSNNGIIDLALGTCLKNHIPHIWHLREYQDLDFNMSIIPSKRVWLKRINKKGNYNIAITKGIFKYFDLRACDICIYDGALRPDKQIKNPPKKKKPFFLFVAGSPSTPGKGFRDALEGFNKFVMRHNDYNLYVIGEIKKNEYWNDCFNYIEQEKITDKVLLLGSREDVYEWMSKATAIIVPSLFEGFGFITAEAMYNDCLVIGRNTAGTKEQFDNCLKEVGKECGLRFNTIDQLIKCLEYASENDTSEIRKNAKNVVSQLYTVEVSCNYLNDYYKSVVGIK